MITTKTWQITSIYTLKVGTISHPRSKCKFFIDYDQSIHRIANTELKFAVCRNSHKKQKPSIANNQFPTDFFASAGQSNSEAKSIRAFQKRGSLNATSVDQ